MASFGIGVHGFLFALHWSSRSGIWPPPAWLLSGMVSGVLLLGSNVCFFSGSLVVRLVTKQHRQVGSLSVIGQLLVLFLSFGFSQGGWTAGVLVLSAECVMEYLGALFVGFVR